jgi:predicted MPP superfamily phosphohydrolase
MNLKTLIIPDLHGKPIWKDMIKQAQPDRVIFLGDYFDCYNIYTAAEQIHNFKEIVEYKTSNTDKEVIILIGNHDHHYLQGIGDSGTSGYQVGAAPAISQVLEENRTHLQMSYQIGEYLFSHAGISSVFLDQVFGQEGWEVVEVCSLVNDLFKYRPKAFIFNGLDPYGNNKQQTPIWIRPEALQQANKNTLKSHYIQIVGHTAVKKIDFEGKSTGKRYYFVDTLDKSCEFLVIDQGIIGVHELNKS